MYADEAELFLRRMEESGFDSRSYERLTIVRTAREYARARGTSYSGVLVAEFPTGVYLEWGPVRMFGQAAEARWLDGVGLPEALDWYRRQRAS